ncbi:hypothetical protein I3843_11G038200 [Carya illinoinensis]|uniref:Uncharacterized protein n=1 Tax=Carya illinoinensis TaxID=32201 RepID=A0A922DLV3_CARIL|nr:hypothetical protein I3842_11G038100 [Carya illinoinensis]KAG7954792.1 hypothetical protein I3843_11G038200 [Carya illinoinensis]
MFPGLYYEIGKRARDLLYKGYAQQPPNLCQFQGFDCSLDITCRIGDIAPGLRTLFNLDIPDSARVELQYLGDYAGITGGLGLKGNPITGYKPLLNFSGVVGSDFLSLGTDLAFDISTRTLNKINAGLSFNSDFLIASINLNDMLDTWKVSCCRVINPPTNTAVAAELKHTFSVNDTALTIGGQHAILPFTLLKARLSTYGRAGALIQQELFEKLVLTIGGELDFMDIRSVPKLGLSVAFNL